MYTNIKTFEDACKATGYNAEVVDSWFESVPAELRKPLLSHAKLVLIAKALNEGWEPNWGDGSDSKYYPYFTMGASGLVYSNVGDYRTNCDAGSRLCYKSEEVAKYAATQFVDLYKDCYLISDQPKHTAKKQTAVKQTTDKDLANRTKIATHLAQGLVSNKKYLNVITADDFSGYSKRIVGHAVELTDALISKLAE